MSFTANTAQVRGYENKLRKLNARGITFAETETINTAAFEAQRFARETLGDKMTLRNTWSRKSIRVNKGTMRTLEASVGSTEEYLAKQEKGGTTNAKGSTGVPIATTVASGEGQGTGPRKKLVRRPNRVGNITLSARAKAGGRKQRNAITISQARRKGQKFVFLELQKRKGIFKLTGGKRKLRVQMVQDLSHRTIVTPRNPWLMPAAHRARNRMPATYARELAKQVDRLR